MNKNEFQILLERLVQQSITAGTVFRADWFTLLTTLLPPGETKSTSVDLKHRGEEFIFSISGIESNDDAYYLNFFWERKNNSITDYAPPIVEMLIQKPALITVSWRFASMQAVTKDDTFALRAIRCWLCLMCQINLHAQRNWN